ncbi:hypothetical protein O181_099093 [Austropuccinia psidii MF-1]|uniref:Uncharacterized protein n=1 Tax=Austropuccinia psidii MF-1 TaxID=1389203 RepID=A0A9Q3JC23_9BASI|nr:hypothetical protein [Austropuccinia psidii MF-1]
MELIRGIEMIKQDFELPYTLVKARFNTLFTKSSDKWHIQLRQAHGDQSWTGSNDSWRFKVETAFESPKFNADKDKDLPRFCKQKDRLTELYPEISELITNIKILRQFRGYLKHAVKSRTTEQSSAEDIINIIEEVTTRTRIGASRVNIKTRFNASWKDSEHRNFKQNFNNRKYKSSDVIRKCRICQSTTHLANKFPKKAKINKIDIEKEPDVEKDGVN